MLRRVTIDNYALIDSLEIDFHEGLNTVTGETGAGKSLLLGALSVVLGGRSDAGVVRDPGKPCVVEAEFDISGLGLQGMFEEADLDYSDTIVIRRVINASGKSRSYIGELPVTLAVLRAAGERLIDIHSQHQTLLLSNPEFQTDLIDSVAGHDALLREYGEAFTRMKSLERRLERLKEEFAENSREEDFLRHRLGELDGAALREGEQEELETLMNELSHASEIKDAMLGSESVLSGDESGVIVRLRNIEQALSRISMVFPRSAELGGRIRSVMVELMDISSEMSAEGERVDADPARLEKTGERHGMLYSLQQKYRVSGIPELIALRDEARERLAVAESSGEEIDALSRELSKTAEKARSLAGKITEGRRRAAPGVEKYVCETASQLGMPHVRFIVEITPSGTLARDGGDRVRFLFSANRSVIPKPVENVASGGETSRLMLSLKSLLARHRQMPTIIFDEIDSGVSGQIADRMGQLISSLAENIQIINITHLPQVASKGTVHYCVYKETLSGATNTMIRRLSEQERVAEIAKMLSGEDVTEAAVEQAKSLLGQN